MIHVGVAEWRAAKNPDALRTTLGSCVGIALYSSKKKMGGVAHILLGEPPRGKIISKGKYAHTALEALTLDIKRLGVEASDLTARIFGGASMFESNNYSFLQNIGTDNVTAVRTSLKKLNINIVAEEVGGSLGRTITMFMEDGRILLKSGGKEKYIYKT